MVKAPRPLLLLALLAAALPTGTAQAGPTARASIVGGSDASIATHPYQAALLRPRAVLNDGTVLTAPADVQFCGAFVLDALHVGTAAHCVFDEGGTRRAELPSTLQVLAGTDRLHTGSGSPVAGERRIDVVAVSFRPGFDPASFDDDAAVLTLADELQESASIQRIPLLTTQVTSGDVTVTGWGETQNPSEPDPNRLKQVTIPFVADSSSSCGQFDLYQPYSAARMLCAGALGKDSCAGDSGGPLARSTGSGWRLAGIVSFGVSPCAPEPPDPFAAGVYTEVWDDAGDNEVDEFLQRDGAGDAPRPVAPHAIAGVPQPGQVLTCPGWTNATSVSYQVFNGGLPREEASADPAYVVQGDDAGRVLQCVSRAVGPDGHGRAESAGVTVQAAPAPPPPPSTPPPSIDPPAPRDLQRPTTSLVRRRCSRTQCTLQLQVTDAPPSAGIRTLRGSGKLSYRSRCRRDGRTRPCTRTRKLSVKPELLGAGRFVVRVRSRIAGRAVLRFVAYDTAGNRQARAREVVVRFGPRT